jgi:replication factor C subunit 1
MKASNVVAAQKGPKIAPDLEEAIEEDDDGDILVDDQGIADDDDENGDLLKDKYIKKPKAPKGGVSKKPAAKKGKKITKDKDPEDFEDESEEEPKPINARAGKTRGTAARGKAKK